MLLDAVLLKKILKVSMTILKDYFYYDVDSLTRFSDGFLSRLEQEYYKFERNVDDDFRFELNNDKLVRAYFTSYFASYHLHDCFVEDCHFTENELDLFENILPKLTAGDNQNDVKPRTQNKNYRELFKGL